MATQVGDDVRATIAEAGVGEAALLADLVELEAIDAVTVDRGTATIVVTAPVVAPTIRDRLEADLRAALTALSSVSDVTVSWEPAIADQHDRVDLLPDVKTVIAVSSGKGGVGKSTVAANLAAALGAGGLAVGLLDADIYGPNAPTLLGATADSPRTTTDAQIVPREAHGVKVMSMDFIVGEDDPIIWRGPMVDDVLHQLTGDVAWGELDALVVDLPPGTGDAHLTLVQHLPVTGAVVVTTPQPVAVDDARRGLEGFAEYGVPILGVVENMSGFTCPDCGGEHRLFGAGGADALAEEFAVPVLGRIPLDPSVGAVEPDHPTPPGIDLPVIGRLAVPRTREERSGHRPPIVLRDDGEVGEALYELATRAAARCRLAVVGGTDR